VTYLYFLRGEGGDPRKGMEIKPARPATTKPQKRSFPSFRGKGKRAKRRPVGGNAPTSAVRARATGGGDLLAFRRRGKVPWREKAFMPISKVEKDFL